MGPNVPIYDGVPRIHFVIFNRFTQFIYVISAINGINLGYFWVREINTEFK
jgi:hypothetical protein